MDTCGIRAGAPDGVATTSSAASAGAAAGPAKIADASVQFALASAALYHRSRVAWFATLHRVSLFLTVFASTGAVAALTQQNFLLAQIVSLIAAVISAAGLAFDFAGGARKHDECRKVYHDLAARLMLDPTCAGDCQATVIRAAANEPATFEAASRVAHNQAIRSLGLDPSHEFVLKRRHAWFRHIWPFTGTVFIQRKDLL